MEKLQSEYQGDLNFLHAQAYDARDLEARLVEFKGIGPVTVNIFLRELRGIWKKAESLPSDLVLLAARDLGLTEASDRAQALADLQQVFRQVKSPPYRFADFESALVRLAKDWCRKRR